MKTHYLKTWAPGFAATVAGHKSFELRRNDRDFKVGDELILQEFDPVTAKYSGYFCHRHISYILQNTTADWGLAEGYCILGLVD